MRLFLQISINDWKTREYQNPLVAHAASMAEDIIGTDIDNQSEGHVVDIVLKLIDQAERILLFISVQPEMSPGGTGRVIQHLLKREDKIQKIALSGRNDWIEDSLKSFESRVIHESDLENIKKLIHAFAED